MCRISNVVRINGRYVYRRRIHYRKIISKPLGLALKTADPKVARHRAALLSARFARVKAVVDTMLENGRTLTGSEIEALFRRQLETELQFYVHSAYENASWSSSVPEVAAQEAEAMRLSRRPDRHFGMTDADRDELRQRGLEADIPVIEDYMLQARETLSDDAVTNQILAIGAPAHAQNVAAARTHLFRALASASARAQRVFDDDIMDAPDPVRALLQDLGEPSAEVARVLGHTTGPINAAPPARDCLFQVYDSRRFSDIIDEVLADLKSEGVWKGDVKQQRRIMETFAWITGDRPLGTYNHLDPVAFKRGLQRIPKNFYFGTRTSGAMARPFSEVAAELPTVLPEERRNHKTINRDLSTMATAAKHLATTSWHPRMPGATVLNFGAARIAIKNDADFDTRPPWTTAHLEILFNSPIYVGNGGALRRLRASDDHAAIWHDAAYFAPLLWFYHHTCREETCGLEVADIEVGHAIPHFHIRDNLTRGRDGEMAGEKRGARRRKLPIHRQLIRLGFLEYVEAIRSEGHTALFPELYINDEKRGGAHFYERAWQHMVSYIGARMPIPCNTAGKGPDIHSIRALGSSFYEVDGVNEIMRADVMGHARATVNGKHYSKRMATEGETTVLRERLEFIDRYVPKITEQLVASPIRLLPLDQRSRVGAPGLRKVRSDAGKGKQAF